MLRRVRWPGWIVIVVLTLSIITTIAKGSQAIINTDKDSTEKESDVQIEQQDSSKYPGLNLKTKTNETSKYTLSISIPTTKSESINDTIHQWIRKQEDDFLSEVEENQGGFDEDYRAHLNIQVETEKVISGLYNLTFYTYQYAGGANGINTIKSFTIDLNDKKHLMLDDILELDEVGLDVIQKYIKKQLISDKDIKLYLIDDLLDEVLNDSDKWEWSVNKKELTLYFNEYEIAAGAAGVIEVNIPLEKIQSYLKENMISQLKLQFKDDEDKQKQEDKEAEENKNSQEDKDEAQDVQLDPNGKYVALTFDDGPSSTVTPRILATLNEYDALATFFMLGSQVDYYPGMAKKVADAGHEVANHTENHTDLTVANREEIHQEIQNSSDKIYNATGQQPKTVRPPYGAYNETVIDVAKENDESIILWSVDSLDWKSLDANAINEVILNNVAPGSIVLMHDIHDSTADALPELLQSLKEQGYEFITVSQLLELQEAKGIGPHYGTLNY